MPRSRPRPCRAFSPAAHGPALEARLPLDAAAAPAEVYDPDSGGGGDFTPDPVLTPMDPVLFGWTPDDAPVPGEWAGGTGGGSDWLDPAAGQQAADLAGESDPASIH